MPRGNVDLRRANGRGSSYYRTQVIKTDPCVYCGEPGASTDHIHPTSDGGVNSWVNFAPTCIKCNNNKGSLSVLGFMLNQAGRISRRNAAKLEAPSLIKQDELPELWFDPLGIVVRDRDGSHAGIRI